MVCARGAVPPGPGGTAIGIRSVAAPVVSETYRSAIVGSPGSGIANATSASENETAIDSQRTPRGA